jgi:hypothetical protein
MRAQRSVRSAEWSKLIQEAVVTVPRALIAETIQFIAAASAMLHEHLHPG